MTMGVVDWHKVANVLNAWKEAAYAIDDIRADCARLEAENAALRARVAELEDIQQQIRNWIDAYPLSVFPEPDFKQVRELLAAGGVTIDCVSASNMRHVLNGIKEIIGEGLA